MSKSNVIEDYLKKIYHATEWEHQQVSVSGLAASMGVVASTASENIRRMTEAGLVDHKPYQGVTLTEIGRLQALSVIRRHRLLETYLNQHLGFEWDEVHEEAEVLEHAVSDRLINRIDEILDHPSHDPHGDPIPSGDGTISATSGSCLDSLGVGSLGAVVRISDWSSALLRYLEAHGVLPGITLEILGREEVVGTTRVRIGDTELDLPAPASAAVWMELINETA